jgi:HAD superfamily hydrolase (TIGR01509 family)
MGRRFDLVIFDLDGTLIDNRAAIRENFNYALKMFGFPQLEDEKVDAMIGTPLVEMFETILPGSCKHLAPKLVEAYIERYRDTSHIGTVVLDDVIPILEKLRDEFKLAVATTKANDTVYLLLQRIGLHKYFDLATGRREGMRNKPHPDMLNYVMRELDVKPERTVMVGDTPIDIFTARNAGIYVVAVTSSIRLGMTTLNKIREAKPDLIIPSLRKLPCDLYTQ